MASQLPNPGRMKILLLSQWYLPEPQKIMGELAQSLQAAGHDVTVVTGFPNWPIGKLYPGYRIRICQRETIDGIKVIRLPLCPNHSKSAFKRALNLGSFVVSLLLLGPVFVPKPDVIHLLQPITAGFPAWMLSRLWRVPLTMEIHDLWPETLEATGLVKNTHLLKFLAVFAGWVYGRTVAIRVISEGFRTSLVNKGVATDKIKVISNWVDTQFYRPLGLEATGSSRPELEGRFNVVFAGAIGPAQGLDTILDAAERLRDIPNVQFIIAGEGVDRDRLSSDAQRRGLPNVRFLGWVDEGNMPALFAQAEVLLLQLRDEPLFRITIPHKLFVYMASGRAILAAVEGDAAEVVRRTGSGITCRPGEPGALADAIRLLVAMSPEDRNAYGTRGREAVCHSYSQVQLTGQIEAMLKNAVKDYRETSYPNSTRFEC